MKILFDKDIEDFISYRQCIKIMEGVIKSKLEDNVVCPPRDWFYNQKGSMVFTKGELIREGVAGFRVTNTPRTGLPDCTQLTVTFDTYTGEMKGLVIGKLIGVYRTACINAVAIKHLSRKNASVLGVLGTGFQARHHALAALEVRDFKEVRIYSRNAENQNGFIEFVKKKAAKTNLQIISANSPEEVVENCDVLICATNSSVPILKTASIKKGLHINGIGPKYKDRSELSLFTVQKADIISTDSIKQLYCPTGPGAVFWAEDIPKEKVVGLEYYMSNFKRNENYITFFCSIGLSGTEVAFANWIIETVQK